MKQVFDLLLVRNFFLNVLTFQKFLILFYFFPPNLFSLFSTGQVSDFLLYCE